MLCRESVGKDGVVAAFEQAALSLPIVSGQEHQLRELAKVAVLATARRHGNIIGTGRVLLSHIDELGAKISDNIALCKDEVLLGLAEGACQIGPIVYGRFLDVASEYRTNGDEWIAKNKRKLTFFESSTPLPIIVPYEENLMIESKPFSSEVQAITSDTHSFNRVAIKSEPEEPNKIGWSRPRQRGIFQRLSDVIGGFFTGNNH